MRPTPQIFLVLPATLFSAAHSAPLNTYPFEIQELPDGYYSSMAVGASGVRWGDDGAAARVVRDLTYSGSIRSFYDSNVGKVQGTAQSPEIDSLVLSTSMSASWERDFQGWNALVETIAGYDHYLNENDYSGGRYGISTSLGYDGGRWSADARLRHNYSNGVNRYFGRRVAQYGYGAGFGFAYEPSPKTSLRTEWDSIWSDPDGGLGGTESHRLNVSALWRYSKLLSLGPGIGWSRESGDLQGNRDSIGPTFTAIYQLSRKVSLNGRVGVQWTDYDGAEVDDSPISAALVARYQPSQLWSLDLGFVRGVTADAANIGSFRETTALRMALGRKIRRANASLGLGYERASYSGGGGRDDVDYLTYDLAVGFPVWADQVTGNFFVRYEDSRSNRSADDWDAYQSGISLNFRF